MEKFYPLESSKITMEDPKDLDMLNSKVSKKPMLPLKFMDKLLMKENLKLTSALKDPTKNKKIPMKDHQDPSENNLVEEEEIIKEEENNLEAKNHKREKEEKENKNPELKYLENNLLPYLLEI